MIPKYLLKILQNLFCPSGIEKEQTTLNVGIISSTFGGRNLFI